MKCIDHYQCITSGSVIENNGCISPAEVYVRIDNELYSGSGQKDSEQHIENGAAQTSPENIYNEPSELKEEKLSAYEFDSPLYASSKETDL